MRSRLDGNTALRAENSENDICGDKSPHRRILQSPFIYVMIISYISCRTAIVMAGCGIKKKYDIVNHLHRKDERHHEKEAYRITSRSIHAADPGRLRRQK